MTRIARFALIATLLAVLVGLLPEAQAQQRRRSTFTADEIKAGLRTATPEEGGFVDYVVGRVEQGALPDSLVTSTFIWARKKPRRKFQYFRFGLIRRAREQGIGL